MKNRAFHTPLLYIIPSLPHPVSADYFQPRSKSFWWQIDFGLDFSRCWVAPNKWNADGAVGIFGKCQARVGYGPAPGTTEKRTCATLARKVGRATNTSADYFRIRYRGKMVFLILVHVHELHLTRLTQIPPPNLSYTNTSKLTWN